VQTKSHVTVEKVISAVAFDDASTIDLVMAGGALCLAVWTGKSVSVAKNYSRDGKTYLPGDLDPMASAIYFPRRVHLDENADKLRADVQIELTRVKFLDQNNVALLTGFIFTSWFTDTFVVAPSLVLVGGGADENDHCLKLLNCFCRRPLLIAYCNGRTFNNLPLRYQPTLLISSVVGEAVVSCLQSTSYAPAKYFHQGEFLETPIMKVMPSAIADTWGDTNPIIPIVLQTVRADKYPAEHYYANLREEFQARLLGHRLRNLHEVRKAAWTKDRTSGPMGPMLDALTICAPNPSVNLQTIFKAQEEEVELERESQADHIICEAALALCHDKGRVQAMVAEITGVANSIAEKRGNPLDLVARATGHQLKRLGIKIVRVGAAGRGVKFDRYTRVAIHKVASHMSLPSAKIQTPGCPDCEALEKRH